MWTIEQVNKLHAEHYMMFDHRKYPKNGIVPLGTVKAAAKWLRKNKKNE